jgi:hypothetical protein
MLAENTDVALSISIAGQLSPSGAVRVTLTLSPGVKLLAVNQ